MTNNVHTHQPESFNIPPGEGGRRFTKCLVCGCYLEKEDSEVATSPPFLAKRHTSVLDRRMNYLLSLGDEQNSYDRAEAEALRHALAVADELKKLRSALREVLFDGDRA